MADAPSIESRVARGPTSGKSVLMPNADSDTDWACAYAARLLTGLGRSETLRHWSADPPATSWARAGLAHVTGASDGPPLAAPIPIAAAADGALIALGVLAHSQDVLALRGSALLGARARLGAPQRRGSTSLGGACKLLRTADGVLAVSLPRDSDWELAPAWLERSAASSWSEVAAALKSLRSDDCLERGRLLGLAVAPADVVPTVATWSTSICLGAAKQRAPGASPLVIDLSSLWAGPLCADLLGRLGARVVKVESLRRPDGARAGDANFYTMLNGGKASICLDFADPKDVARLDRLIRGADVVIESARPRALRQLGIDAEGLVRETPGLSWIALSAYGREEPEANWIGFGDDCGAAGGLSRLMRDVSGEALFCGDAIADPLTGIHAALLAWSSWTRGGGCLNAIALRDVVAWVAAADAGVTHAQRRTRWLAWNEIASTVQSELYPLPPARGVAEPLGASNRLLESL